jgi:chromosomal replication initiation ATPase DnaA
MTNKVLLGKNPKANKHYPGVERHFHLLPEELRHIIEALCDGHGRWPLFLHGKVGRGKSYAALCLFDRVGGSEFWSMPDFIEKYRRVKDGREWWSNIGNGGYWTVDSWWQYITRLPLLVLDDVALHEENNQIQTETLFRALEARTRLPLVVTSNRDPDGIGLSYDDRIRSRLCCGTIYELEGDDLRYKLR